jgi:hypothetical protein
MAGHGGARAAKDARTVGGAAGQEKVGAVSGTTV